MNSNELQHRLLTDLIRIKLPVDDIDLFIRPYSKTYFGRYYPVREDACHKPKIYIYPFMSDNEHMYPYDLIIETMVHEMCHHLQFINPFFKRKKGIMHDVEFWKLYNRYIGKLKSMKGSS